MWIKSILFATLALLGNAAVLNDMEADSSRLDALIEELKEREIRRPGTEFFEDRKQRLPVAGLFDDRERRLPAASLFDDRERRLPAASLFDECKSKPADIAFIIDDSRSIYGPDFNIGMEFIKNFVRVFQIGPQNVRIAAIAFGHLLIEHTAFGFERNLNKQKVLNALSKITFQPNYGDKTYTDMALNYARTRFFNRARPNVNKVAIVLTDGKSDHPEKTKEEAEYLKRQNVNIIAIGVGDQVEKAELNAIASRPDNVFLVMTYRALNGIIGNLGFITCQAPTTVAPTTVAPTTTTTTVQPKAEPCDGQVIDFNFVFDPAQMGTSGTEETIRFIKTVVSAEDLNNGKVRVGTITGPCPDTKGFRLNRYQNIQEIQTHFDSYRRTDIHSLITDLRTDAFHPENGGRVNARKVGVLFLRGKLSYPKRAILEAKLAQAAGIEIFIVDMGSLNHVDTLESLVGGKTSHILRASDSGEMIEMARTLVANICRKKAGGRNC